MSRTVYRCEYEGCPTVMTFEKKIDGKWLNVCKECLENIEKKKGDVHLEAKHSPELIEADTL